MPQGSTSTSTPAALPPAMRGRLVGILSRLDSDFDGERAAAALLASRLLRSQGLRWADLVPELSAPQPERPSTAAPDVAADLALLQRHRHLLGGWMEAFLAGCLAQRKPLSDKQRHKLAEGAAALRVGGLS